LLHAVSAVVNSQNHSGIDADDATVQ